LTVISGQKFEIRFFQLILRQIKYSALRVFDYTEGWRERAQQNPGNHLPAYIAGRKGANTRPETEL